VAVIGGGNSALGAARYLSNIAKQVYLVHRRDEFRGEEFVVKELKKKENVELILNVDLIEIKGQSFVESLIVKDKKTNQTREISLNGIFVEIGYVAKTDFIKDLVKLNKAGEIITDKKMQTSCAGIFACGDVTDVEDKQIIISAGQGAQAALQAYKYLVSKKEEALPDWE
jgi:thioredoxin reductase (NADPH)